MYLNCGQRYIHDWSSQLYTQLKQFKIEAEKKIQAWTGFEPMTSTIPVHYSTNWPIKPSGNWSLCEFVIHPYKVKNANEPMKDHIFELRRKIFSKHLGGTVRFQALTDVINHEWIFLRSSNIWSFIYSFAFLPFHGIVRTHKVTSSQMAW